jgi:hypothetical protein
MVGTDVSSDVFHGNTVLSSTPCSGTCSPVCMVVRDGEQGEEWVKWLPSVRPSAARRSRHGRRTDGGSHRQSRSWSEMTKRMFGCF